jgi:hypothetical protein
MFRPGYRIDDILAGLIDCHEVGLVSLLSKALFCQIDNCLRRRIEAYQPGYVAAVVV